jgi:hypothetical protein
MNDTTTATDRWEEGEMDHDSTATVNTVVSGNGRLCFRLPATEVFAMTAGRCECQNPGCSEHSEEYKCRELASGLLTDHDGYSMELCPGCAANELTGLELNQPKWELFELPELGS